jgi:hypothetical protein
VRSKSIRQVCRSVLFIREAGCHCYISYSVSDRRIDDYKETLWQRTARENFSAIGEAAQFYQLRRFWGCGLLSTGRHWQRAKKIPEAANPRGAEDSSYFRGRLARLIVTGTKFFSALTPDGTNSTTIAKTGQYDSGATYAIILSRKSFTALDLRLFGRIRRNRISQNDGNFIGFTFSKKPAAMVAIHPLNQSHSRT